MNLIQIFQPSLRGRAEKPAIITAERRLTFGELDRHSDALARSLRQDFGLRKGDRAAMFVENCSELIIYYLACLKIGAIVVPFNILYRDHELSYLLQDAAPKVLLADQERLKTLEPLVKNTASLQKIFLADAADDDSRALNRFAAPGSSRFEMEQVDGDDPALIV